MKTPWPTELRLVDGGARLVVHFNDGACFDLAAPYLRSRTPSAADRGHGPITPLPDNPGVRITDVRPVGRYAVRLVFDDGHDTGLYTFDQLYALGRAI